jgi:hypothetical protein
MLLQRIWELHHRRFIGTFKTSTTDRFSHGYIAHHPTSHYDCAILCGDAAGYSAVVGEGICARQTTTWVMSVKVRSRKNSGLYFL